MDATTSIKPKTMAELLPGLNGILSKDAIQTLTAKKQPRSTITHTRTTEKVLKPMTIAEMRADILALKVKSPRRSAQGVPSTKKRIWNSSVKLESKLVSHTSNGKMQHNPVKKMLNFQPKPKPVSRTTMAPASPKFPKPEVRPKKSIAFQARNNVRISGISHISETPVISKPTFNRMTLANKENIPRQAIVSKFVTPKISQKRLIPLVQDTPISNESWKSSCDASFLQNEQESNAIEEKTKAINEEKTLENIAEVTPPISTPFKEYRSVQDYFNNSNDLENSAIYNDNTIMCFDKPSDDKRVNSREESVIVSLCDLLNKASVANSDKISTEIEDLLEIEKQTEYNIKVIENSIYALTNIKESQIKSLMYVKKLINDKRTKSSNKTLADTTVISVKETTKVIKTENTGSDKKLDANKQCSVIKSCSKSPSYRIPKKNSCLRKNVFHKSMPNISNELNTPVKADMGNKALSVYMKMKEHMIFLNTPKVKPHLEFTPDTPAVTSQNLQKQLDKLYEGV